MTVKADRLRFFLVVAIFVAVAALGWFFGPSGTVHGIEFSPDRFAHRSFRYYVWCGVPITPSRTHEFRTPVDEYVHAHGFVPDSDARSPRWDLVKGFAPHVRGWHGNAKSMCKALGCWSGSDRLVRWSTDHPDLAEIVWPKIVEWARRGEYRTISTFFSLCGFDCSTSPDDVRETIRIVEADTRE
jgi:hypothetical protein